MEFAQVEWIGKPRELTFSGHGNPGCHANPGAFGLASGKGLTSLALSRSRDFWPCFATAELQLKLETF